MFCSFYFSQVSLLCHQCRLSLLLCLSSLLETFSFQVSLWNKTGSQYLRVIAVKSHHTLFGTPHERQHECVFLHVCAHSLCVYVSGGCLRDSLWDKLAHSQQVVVTWQGSGFPSLTFFWSVSNVSLEKRGSNPLSPLPYLSVCMRRKKRRERNAKRHHLKCWSCYLCAHEQMWLFVCEDACLKRQHTHLNTIIDVIKHKQASTKKNRHSRHTAMFANKSRILCGALGNYLSFNETMCLFSFIAPQRNTEILSPSLLPVCYLSV